MWDVMWEHLGAVVAAAALLSNIAAIVIGLKVRNATLESEVRVTKKIDDAKTELSDRADEHERDIAGKVDGIRREFGETAAALRNKIHEVETWARDTFVRRDSFYKVSDELKADLNAMGEKIEKRLERMEGKIDGKPKGHAS